MKFSIFDNVRSQQGRECTLEEYLKIACSNELNELCGYIAKATDPEDRQRLKKCLPIITWQAYFPNRRKNTEAQPSGLFMLDIDHVEDPYALWCNIANNREQWGIVFAGMTASRHGLRLVARCRPEFKTLAECQRWLATQIDVEYDEVCKDFARSSYVVHDSYTYYIDQKAIWTDTPAEGTIYDVATENETAHVPAPTSSNEDQREGLFGRQTEYKGVSLERIALEWLEQTGGLPQPGERNARLYKCALRMRYLTDFNAATIARVLPSCGLSQAELQQIAHSAVQTMRAADMPEDMRQTLQNIDRQIKLGADPTEETLPPIEPDPPLPPMPPIIRQFVDNAPDDFKIATALVQLPILGTLASRLRAVYLDGRTHSPSFLVSLEAPQASGKSFLTRIVEYEMAQVIEHDERQRQLERDYNDRVKEMKMLNIKVNAENKDDVLGQRPRTLIRYVPATMSITKLLMRANDAQGLHLFAFAPEVDTVTKAFKRGFSSYSDLLRIAFDNDLYGQDYASENSFSGTLPIFYNMVNSGTPAAMRRFYPDVEDGLVSRVCFVTLPDQFGKPMPVWKELDEKQKAIVDMTLVRLGEISLIGDDVQPEHEVKLDWLNKEIGVWLEKQQRLAVQMEDRTRDIFCRRAAVVGFRAGMLAYALYGLKSTPTIRRNVIKFAIWTASQMLHQQVVRFNVENPITNTVPFSKLYNALPKKFVRREMSARKAELGISSNNRQILYKWKEAGVIEEKLDCYEKKR